MEDILEEIVGEFTTDIQTFNLDIQPQEDDSFLIDCTVHLREINRKLKWHLPYRRSKTLNGLLLEQLEYIPETGTTLKISDYLVEITQVSDSAVKIAKMKAIVSRSKTANN